MKNTSLREAIGSRELAENVARRARPKPPLIKSFWKNGECPPKRFLKTCR